MNIQTETSDDLGHPSGKFRRGIDAGWLTDSDRRLLEWLAAGRTNAQIGMCSSRSEKTVRNQLTRLYAKLDVVNRAEAVAVYLRSGSTQPSL